MRNHLILESPQGRLLERQHLFRTNLKHRLPRARRLLKSPRISRASSLEQISVEQRRSIPLRDC
jgi:hypothetical protein